MGGIKNFQSYVYMVSMQVSPQNDNFSGVLGKGLYKDMCIRVYKGQITLAERQM